MSEVEQYQSTRVYHPTDTLLKLRHTIKQMLGPFFPRGPLSVCLPPPLRKMLATPTPLSYTYIWKEKNSVKGTSLR